MAEWLTVTQEDIDNAGGGAYKCPIATALQRQFACKASAHYPCLYVWTGDEERASHTTANRAVYATSRSLNQFMLAYDKHGKTAVKPRRFKLTRKYYKGSSGA